MTQSILITGCSSGIGLDAARTLHARGWKVFASCRQAQDVERLQAEGLTSLRLDHDDPASILEATATVLEATGGTLDAVFANGAYAIPGRVEDLPRDALRAIFETNLFGPFDLVNRIRENSIPHFERWIDLDKATEQAAYRSQLSSAWCQHV